MEILVNKEPLDFTLESESSIGEVVDGLAEWLKGSQFAITGIDIDALPQPLGLRDRWADIAIDDVSQLSIEALPYTRVDWTTAKALDEYFAILQECIREERHAAFADAAGELPYVRQQLAKLFPELPGIDDPASILRIALDPSGSPVFPKDTNTILLEISSMRSILGARIREFEDPRGELRATLATLATVIPGLEEIPVELQTGKASEALGKVVALTELLGRAVRLTPLAEEDGEETQGAAVRETARELGPFLNELSDALESGDTVLVGDLIEYEIAPVLLRLSVIE